MSCRRRRGYRRFSTSAYRLLGDFEVAIKGGVWVATGVLFRNGCHGATHCGIRPSYEQLNATYI